MVILETALLLTAILVGVGSALFLRSVVQKNQNAEKKYRQEREARDSAEGALRRAEDEHREAERKLQQAQDETRAANTALDAALEQARLANEHAQRAEESQKQAETARAVTIRERDEALEQARGATERAQRAEELRKQAERERDVSIAHAQLAEQAKTQAEDVRDTAKRERDEAIQARKTAEENARQAIQAKFDAEERARQAERKLADAVEAKGKAERRAKRAKDAFVQAKRQRDDVRTEWDAAICRAEKAEKERDDAIDRVRSAEQAQKCAEDARDKAIRERDVARKRAAKTNQALKLAIKATKPATKHTRKGIPPEERKGARDRYKHPIAKFAPRDPRPEIICQDKNHKWMLAIQLPEDFLNSGAESQVDQDDFALEQIGDLWQLEDVHGRIRVQSGEKALEFDLGKREEEYLLFKLSGYDLRHGTRVRSINKGAYLVVVPEDWDREDSDLGSEPEAVSVEGYLAYYHVVDQPCKITFRTPDGKSVDVAQSTTQFDLIGKRLPDAEVEGSPLFGGEPPHISASSPSDWQVVKTVVVGEEGRDREEWESARVTLNKSKAEQELPHEISKWKASWFFVRFYDENDQLIESMDFRLARGLSDFRVNQTSPLPTETGHSATSVEFHHTADCRIVPPPDLETKDANGITTATIPPSAAFDKTCWNITTPDPKPIQVTILAERIWWAVGTKDRTPPDSEWIAQPLSLTRADFVNITDKSLWIRLPKPRWTDTHTVRVGFAQETARPLAPGKAVEQTALIRLNDFCDSASIRQIGLSRFVMRVDNSVATLAEIRVQAKCRFCDFAAGSAAEILSHVESRHLNAILPPLTYDEHVRRNPNLTVGLAICKHPNCTISWKAHWIIDAQTSSRAICQHAECKNVDHSVDSDGLANLIKDHIRQKHDTFSRKKHPADLIPDIRKCALCDWEKENPSKDDLLRHLKENHLNTFYELR
ncbi:MAG: hypothetical protein FJ009_18800 [Chloroflexi bacterium]|nr:hypothetical protein [Chloroflexota bacterium]